MLRISPVGKLKKKKIEEPEIDENMYYGEDDEDYDEQDNRVTDNNDYYE